jgi:uncharacterized caspase-like protein
LKVKRAAPDGTRPLGVAIDASGQRVGVGYDDEPPRVSIFDAKTLALLTKAQTADLDNGALSSVAWSRDGATLIAGGSAVAQFQGEWRRFLRRFDAHGRRQVADVAVSDNTIMDIKPCGGDVAFGAQDPLFGLLSPQGVATTLQSPRTADMRDKLGLAFMVSPNASSVRFGLADGEEKPLVFDLAAASLTDSPSIPAEFTPARVDGLPITDWEDNYAPKFGGTKLALDAYEYSRAVAIRPDASGFVLGADYYVRGYDDKGKELWNRPGPGVAWGVNFSADGGIVAVAYDGTIRWLRWRDGAELLAFFVEPQSRKWVAWTPSGYYMASAGGEDLIGWHVNRGWNQEADFFPASQFRAQYNRPDIVRLVLKTRDEAEAVRQANLTSDRSVEAKPIGAVLPPVVAIVSPQEGAHFSEDSVEIAYSLRSPSGLPIDRLDVLADGQPIKSTGFTTTKGSGATGSVTITPPKKDATISLIGYSGGLTSAPVGVKLVYDRPVPPAAPAPNVTAAPDTRPKLYALLVGVTNYEDNELNDIHFGARDAEGFAQALERQKGGLYADVQTQIVDFPTRKDFAVNNIGPPTRDSVFKGLYWLKHVATDNDLIVVFLSGHGYRDYSDPKGGFWFLTREAKIDELPTTAISGSDLYRQISTLAGKKILFIDACHVGTDLTANTMAVPFEAFPNMDKFVNDFTTAGSGIVVYAASQAVELAHEDSVGQHGAFAEALIEAIGEGKGANPDGRITADLLHFYVVERVRALTNGAQHPVWNLPGTITDFPVALMRR